MKRDHLNERNKDGKFKYYVKFPKKYIQYFHVGQGRITKTRICNFII